MFKLIAFLSLFSFKSFPNVDLTTAIKTVEIFENFHSAEKFYNMILKDKFDYKNDTTIAVYLINIQKYLDSSNTESLWLNKFVYFILNNTFKNKAL